uniref:Eukaryotic translation initiation factor 5B-like n=1 Tax=Saccoglossus kowalevskii TaxID=10224 RepID=A0ABM0MQR2_SACKO|nr:PREDICTED: eukaryotic translation initiation factor 5B-like [Saccoglossus kowalevskii]
MKKSSSKSKKKAKVVQMLNSETNLSVDSDMKDEEESNIKKLKRKKKTARMVCSTSRTEERSSTEKTTKKKKKVIIADRDDTKIGAELLESGSGIKKGNKKIKAKEGKGKTTTLKEKKKKSARLDEKGSQDQGDAQIVMKPAPKQISIMDEKEVDKKRKKKLKSKSKIIAENTADVEEEEIKYDDAETLEPNEARVVEKSLINGHQESDEDKKLRNSNKINEKCEEILEPDGMNMDKSSEKDDDNEKNEEMATIDVEQINGDKNKEIVTEEEKEGSAVDVGIPTETIIVINTETKIVDIPLKDNQIMEVEETAVNHDSDNEKKNILNLHFTDDFVPNSHDSSSASDTVKFVSKPKKKSLLSHQPKINQDGLSESCDGSKPTLTPMKKKTKSKEVRSVSKKKLKQSHDDIQESLKSKEVARKVDSKKKNAQCEYDGVDEDDGGADEVVFKSAASSDDVEQMVEIGIRHLREITPKKSSDSDGGQSKNTVKDNSLFDKDSLGESLSNEANALPTNKRTPEAIKSPDSMNVDKSQVTGVVTDEEVVIFQSDEETTKTNRGLEKSPMIHVDNKSEEQLLSISGERKEDEPTSGDLCGSTIETNNVLSEDKNHKASSITSTTKTLEKEPEKNSIPFHKRIIDVVFSSDERKSDDDIVDEIVDERSRVRTKRKSGKKTPKKAFPDEATSKAEKKSITSEIVDLASSSDIDIKSDVANEVSVVSIPRKGAKKTSKKVSVGGVTSRGDKILITQEMKDVASSSDEMLPSVLK